MPNLIDYFFPKRKLYRTPKHITAEYNRGDITKEQSIIIMAGLARDPHQAQQVLNELRDKHGGGVWDYVHFHVRRKRAKSFKDRLLTLLRRILGETEYQNYRSSPQSDDYIPPDIRFK